MPSAADVFWMLHLGVLAVFVGSTALLLFAAILSRLRVRRPLLIWHQGPLSRIPIGPSLFLLVLGLGLAGLQSLGHHMPPSVVVGYPAGGLFWFIATWLVRTVMITEYGLVPDLLRLRGAVAWSQIVDFTSTSRDGQPHFVFYYQRGSGDEPCRLVLPVPKKHVSEFRQLLRAKLQVRPAFSEHDVALADAAGRN